MPANYMWPDEETLCGHNYSLILDRARRGPLRAVQDHAGPHCWRSPRSRCLDKIAYEPFDLKRRAARRQGPLGHHELPAAVRPGRSSVTVHGAAGDWSIFQPGRPVDAFGVKRRWPKTWTCPLPSRPVNGYQQCNPRQIPQAEGVRFELTVGVSPTQVFKTCALNHSANPPKHCKINT